MIDCFKKYVIFQIYILYICSQNHILKPLVDDYCSVVIKSLENNTDGNDLSLSIKTLIKPSLNLYAELDLPLSFNYKQTKIDLEFWYDLLTNIIKNNVSYLRYNFIFLEKKLDLNLNFYRNIILDHNTQEDILQDVLLNICENIIVIKKSDVLKLAFLYLNKINLIKNPFSF